MNEPGDVEAVVLLGWVGPGHSHQMGPTSLRAHCWIVRALVATCVTAGASTLSTVSMGFACSTGSPGRGGSTAPQDAGLRRARRPAHSLAPPAAGDPAGGRPGGAGVGQAPLICDQFCCVRGRFSEDAGLSPAHDPAPVVQACSGLCSAPGLMEASIRRKSDGVSANRPDMNGTRDTCERCPATSEQWSG